MRLDGFESPSRVRVWDALAWRVIREGRAVKRLLPLEHAGAFVVSSHGEGGAGLSAEVVSERGAHAHPEFVVADGAVAAEVANLAENLRMGSGWPQKMGE